MESMRVNRSAMHLTLLHGGATNDRQQAVRRRARDRAMLRLVRDPRRELSPSAQALLGWLDTATYATTPDLTAREDLDLLRIDVAARLAHEAGLAARGRARAGEAS